MESKQIEAIAAFESEVKTVVDPLPAGTLGMYLFLASEAMFFIGLIGAYIVLKSAGGQHDLFLQAAAVPRRLASLICAGLLLGSSCCLLCRPKWSNWYALLMGSGYLEVQSGQWEFMARAGFKPAHDNFSAMYVLITGSHCVHLLLGMIALLWNLMFRSGKLADSVQIYWHFVNLVGLITLAALYWL